MKPIRVITYMPLGKQLFMHFQERDAAENYAHAKAITLTEESGHPYHYTLDDEGDYVVERT